MRVEYFINVGFSLQWALADADRCARVVVPCVWGWGGGGKCVLTAGGKVRSFRCESY